MKNEEIAVQIIKAINEGPIITRLDRIELTQAEHGRHLALHDTELAVLRRDQNCDVGNWKDVREVIIDMVKMVLAAVVGAVLAGKLTP